MGKSRPRYRRLAIIVEHERSWLVRTIETILTLLVWAYMLFILYLIMSILFKVDSEWKDILLLVFHLQEQDIRQCLYIILSLVFGLFIVQFVWLQYNYRRYSKLHRRKFPAPVETKEIADHFSLTEEEVQYLQETSLIKLKERLF